MPKNHRSRNPQRESPWNLCDQNAYLYCIAEYPQRVENTNAKISSWYCPRSVKTQILENARNCLHLTSQHHFSIMRAFFFFPQLQKRIETVKQFHSNSKEVGENCKLEKRSVDKIGDLFITNMLKDDIQRELLRDTFEPERALSIALNKETVQKTSNQFHLNSRVA